MRRLRVWHIPQIGGPTFYVEVKSLREAKLLMHVLADYDLFQFDNRIKPDYANANGLTEFDPTDDTDGPEGSWTTWYNDDSDEIADIPMEEAERLDRAALPFHI